MYFIYNFLLRLLTLLLSPFWLTALVFIPGWRAGLWARLAWLPRARRDAFGDLPRPRIWFHAASVGELSAVAPIAAAFKERNPAAAVLVSTATLSGLALAAEKIPAASQTLLLPLDFPGTVRRMLRLVEPDLLVITETELWPNLVREAKRAGCQLALVNGRMSPRSFQRYRLFRGFLRQILACFDLLAVQTESDGDRFLTLGANPQRVKIAGNTKFDQVPTDGVRSLGIELRLPQERPVWVAGSTRPGEEEIVLDAFLRVRAEVPEAVLVLAPRHLERLRAVEHMLGERRLSFTHRSRVARELLDFPVILVDTMGELAKLYGLGRVAFVGGSLVPLGGHNPLEPAVLGVPVLFGPHTEHFAKTVEILKRRGRAQEVASAEELAAAVIQLLLHPEEAQARGEAARQAVSAHRGAAELNAELLQKLMLIKRWSAEVKGWRAETSTGAPKAIGKDSLLDDWPEWPL
jgi:3-deoxy-D-manno-octulosonic-acid transferase